MNGVPESTSVSVTARVRETARTNRAADTNRASAPCPLSPSPAAPNNCPVDAGRKTPSFYCLIKSYNIM